MKILLRHKTTVILGLAFFLAAGNSVSAQVSAVPDPIQYAVAPDLPGPNQETIIQIQGVGTFLGDATISWQQNGKTVSSGIGDTQFSFTTGALGTVTRIHIVINSPSKGTFTKDFSFIPSSVTLLWEANTSVPLLYKGKALYSAGSSVKVVAFPTVVSNGSTISSNNLSFQWSRGDTPVPEQSGKGRSTFSFDGSQLQGSENVSVDVYLGDVKVGHGGLTIAAAQPQLVLYYKDPLRGMLLQQALPSAVSLNGSEITVQAQPYYFADQSIANGSAVYAWTLNGNTTSGPDSSQGILTLRQTGTGAGQAQLDASLQDTGANTFVQSAEAALTLVFGQSNSSVASFFGL